MKAIRPICVALALAGGTATASDDVPSEAGKRQALISDAVKIEAIKCYVMAADVPGGMTVGLAVTLCSGTTDAERTIRCVVAAFTHPDDGGLGLSRGLAVNLCKSNSLEL